MPTKEIAPGVLAVTELPEISKKDYWTVISNSLLVSWTNKFNLPPGSWKVLGWSDELTENQCQLFCHSIFGKYYKDYMSKETEGYAPTWTLDNSSESFASLLRSHGITDRALIIKKEKL